MIDQAYEQGCETALQELAEAFGDDVVGELVKIAKEKEMSKGQMAAMLGAGAAGAGAAGYGGWHGGKALGRKAQEWASTRASNVEGKLHNKNLGKDVKNRLSARQIAEVGNRSHKRWSTLGKGANKWTGMGAAGLAGAGLLGYTGKKAAE